MLPALPSLRSLSLFMRVARDQSCEPIWRALAAGACTALALIRAEVEPWPRTDVPALAEALVRRTAQLGLKPLNYLSVAAVSAADLAGIGRLLVGDAPPVETMGLVVRQPLAELPKLAACVRGMGGGRCRITSFDFDVYGAMPRGYRPDASDVILALVESGAWWYWYCGGAAADSGYLDDR